MSPSAGDHCTPNGSVSVNADGDVLVCRSGVWQFSGDAAPIDVAALPSRDELIATIEREQAFVDERVAAVAKEGEEDADA